MKSNKWSDFVEKNLFTSKEDFFVLPYLANTPKIMINSFFENTIANHYEKEQVISSDNSFFKAVLRYRTIEEGLWFLSTSISLKENILAKSFYDSNIQSDYYTLTFSIFEYEFPLINNKIDSKKLLSKCWTFSKPNTRVETYFHKGTSGSFCNIIFSKKWASENIFKYCGLDSEVILKFLNSETGFLNFLDIVPKITSNLKEIDKVLKADIIGKINIEALKNPINTLIYSFFEEVVNENRIQNYTPLKNEDYASLAQAEKIILQNLSKTFIGVEQIAEMVHISPTKLKANFKMVYGLSLLQYYKQKNVQLAEQLIKNSEIPIKHIATITGYQTASKFAATFKKYTGKLPSEYRTI